MKKITSLLLTAILLATMLCVFSVPAFAEGETESVNKPEGAEWLVDEGDNHVWYKLTENDTKLIIDGEGAMPDYDNTTFEDRPWHSAAETVTAVQINPGITTLGDYAFYQFVKMTSVTIPDGVTSIGDAAFHHCESLESVTIPSSVTSIGISAFGHCKSLTSVTIPYGVTSIGNMAFMNCTSLKSVSFPSSITSIDNLVLELCSNLTSVTVKAKTPPTWMDLDSLITRDVTFTVYIPDGTSKDYNNGARGRLISQGKVKEAYIVDDQPGKNGTIMLDKDSFPEETYTAANETVTVTVMPAEGYQLKADSLSVVAENGEAIALTQDETDPMKYTFTMPCSNVTVKAEFEEITDESEPTLTATVFSEGNIWIIIAVAVVVIAGIATLVIVKKKKKPALAGGENTEEE